MKTLIKEKMNSLNKFKSTSTGSVLLDAYTVDTLKDLANDVFASSKLRGQNVKDFLLETRSW